MLSQQFMVLLVVALSVVITTGLLGWAVFRAVDRGVKLTPVLASVSVVLSIVVAATILIVTKAVPDAQVGLLVGLFPMLAGTIAKSPFFQEGFVPPPPEAGGQSRRTVTDSVSVEPAPPAAGAK